MKSGKRHMTDGIELPNQDKITTLGEKETYKYLGILEDDTIKQVEIKEKIQKEYLRRTGKLFETKLCGRNLYISLVRYSGSFLKWTREELMQMYKRTTTTKKLMNIHKELHPRDYVDRICVSKKREEEGLPALKTALTHRYNDSRTA